MLKAERLIRHLQGPGAARIAARRILLAVPLLLAVAWAALGERHDYRDTRQRVSGEAEQAAQAEAQIITLRLMRQFQELSFIATGFIGAQGPERLTGERRQLLLHFAAAHPELYAINVQSVHGGRIVWSTRPQPARPITAAAGFTPLSDQPEFLLGRGRFALRSDDNVLTLRVRSPPGAPRYFVGSPYRLSDLLATGARTPFTLVARDLRDGSILGRIAGGRVTFPKAVPEGPVRRTLAGMPLAVEAGWPPGYVGQRFRQQLPARLAVRALAVLFVALAVAVVAQLLRRTQRLADRNAVAAAEAMAARQLSEGLFDTIGALAMVMDAQGNILRLNAEAERFMGYALAEVRGIPYFWERFIPQDERPRVRRIFEAMRDNTLPRETQNHWVSRTGERRLFHWSNTIMRDARGQPVYLITVGTDITERTRLARQNAQLLAYNSLLGQVNHIIARAEDASGLLQTICELAVSLTNVALAWIGRPDEALRFEFLAKAGPALGYLEDAVISADPEIPEGQGPAGRVWREHEPLFDVAIDAESPRSPWRERAARHGLAATATLPVLRRGEIWGVFVLYIADESAFDDALRALLAELADDLSHGLEHLEMRRLNQVMLDHSDAGVALAHHCVLEFGNARLAQMLGLDGPGDLAGRQMRSLYASAAAYAATEARCQGRTQGGAVRMEAVEFARRDGTPVLADLVGVHMDEGRSVWTFIGVDERERQRRAYLELERLYRALMRAADVLLQAEDEQAILQETCARLVDDTMFHAVWIGRPGPDGLFRVLARAGANAAMVDAVRVPVDHPDAVVSAAWRRAETAFHNDQRAAVPGPWREALIRHDWAAVLGTPIRRGSVVWAVLVFVAPGRDVFNASSVELCERVAALLGRGLDEIDHKAAMATLRLEESHRARHDALTHLPNRLSLAERLPQAIARAQRRGTRLAVGMIDLDDFKAINDALGHDAGDLLLRTFADRIEKGERETDFFARLGGDEFVVVFEDLDEREASEQIVHALQRLHRAVEQPFDLGAGTPAHVGMSVGLALYPDDAQEPDALLRLADAAMYQVKMHKTDRLRWWRMWRHAPDSPIDLEPRFDPFGHEANRMLADGQAGLEAVTQEFVSAFGMPGVGPDGPAHVLPSLSAPERERVKASLAAHLRFLLHPDTTTEAIVGAAARLGHSHALSGVTSAWMSEAQQAYQDILHNRLEHMAVTARHRYRLLRVVTARLQLDIGAQLNAMQSVFDGYSAFLARPISASATWRDQVQDEIDALSALPGIVSCVLMRPNAEGVFVVEFASGEAAPQLAGILKQAGTRPEVGGNSRTGRGLVPEAWRTRAIQLSDAYLGDARTQPWHAALAALGVRSMVAIPVQLTPEHMFVLGIQGRHHHQFSAQWMRTFAESLRLRLIHLVRAAQARLNPVDEADAARHRGLLYADGLRILVQPVVDLRSGQLVKVEALARSMLPDGSLIMPAQFLSAFGQNELDALFRFVLKIGLTAWRGWQAHGLDIDLAVNLAPSTLANAACLGWVADALREHGVAPGRLSLELLETEASDNARHREAIEKLQGLGVQVGIDDLGAGYSGLNRLATLPYDFIKVDQGLVGEIAVNPARGFGVVHSVLQIAHDLDRSAVVEGLDTHALVEAVTVLGARHGQGFGIARPLPPDALVAWAREAAFGPFSPEHPRTFLGALAYHWMCMHRNMASHEGSLEQCPLTDFLLRHGRDARDACRWHAEVHGPDATATARASRRLGEWLLAGVKGEAVGTIA
ncbi:MAG: EAL domain-containing protein [Betaproteobacteria bacterium]|nr:EAL domain-containing protein [Betaproteobacteria bacterium]